MTRSTAPRRARPPDRRRTAGEAEDARKRSGKYTRWPSAWRLLLLAFLFSMCIGHSVGLAVSATPAPPVGPEGPRRGAGRHVHAGHPRGKGPPRTRDPAGQNGDRHDRHVAVTRNFLI